jgi:hypothetical protein
VLNVIFVGNSYTFYHDLPRMTAHLLKTDRTRLRAGHYLLGGATLKGHWLHNLGQAGEQEDPSQLDGGLEDWRGRFDILLEDGPWDYVVLQGNSLDPLRDWGFEEAARLWCDKLREESPETKVVFFMTWARQDEPQQQAAITSAYRAVARANGARIAPVGEAWKAAVEARPDLKLYAKDGSHPSRGGTYLAACVFYATLTGKSPVGLPYRPREYGPAKTVRLLSDGDALFLQEVAWQACLENKEAMASGSSDASGSQGAAGE